MTRKQRPDVAFNVVRIGGTAAASQKDEINADTHIAVVGAHRKVLAPTNCLTGTLSLRGLPKDFSKDGKNCETDDHHPRR
jgi:hypothetical protein